MARGSRRLGFEFKHTNAPAVSKSMTIALEDLRLERIDVIHLGDGTYPLTSQIRAVAFARIQEDITPLN